MNKIFNWTIGSVFRTLGRIFAYLLVGVLLGLFMQKNNLKIIDLLGINTIHASEITTNTPKGYSFQYDSCSNYYCEGSNDPYTVNTGIKDFGTSTTINNRTYNYIFRNGIVNTYSFNSNNTYVFNYRIHLGGNNSNLNNIITFQLYNNWKFSVLGYKNSTDGYIDDYINSSSCSVRFDDSTNNGFLVSCNVALNVNVNRINIQTLFYNPDLIYGNEYLNYDFTSVRVNLISVIENEGQGALIDKQTNQLINNQNKNTEDIINNNNENTEKIIQSGYVCKEINGNDAPLNGYIDSSGNFVSQTGYSKATNYEFVDGSLFTVLENSTSNRRICFYKSNKDFIKCTTINTLSVGSIIPVPAEAQYYRINFDATQPFTPVLKKCINGNQATNESINNLNDSINDDDTSGATSSAGGFFSSFNTDTHGLTGIITAPLTAINRLTSTNCSPLVLPLPFVNQNLTLPCMRPIYTSNFGSFMDLYDVVVIGIISYWILVRIFALVKDFKNPEHDEIEVMDL